MQLDLSFIFPSINEDLVQAAVYPSQILSLAMDATNSMQITPPSPIGKMTYSLKNRTQNTKAIAALAVVLLVSLVPDHAAAAPVILSNLDPLSGEDDLPTRIPNTNPEGTNIASDDGVMSGLQWSHLSSLFLEVMCENDGRAIVLGFLFGAIGTWIIHIVVQKFWLRTEWGLRMWPRSRSPGINHQTQAV